MKNLTLTLFVLFPVFLLSQTQNENYVKTITYKVPSDTTIAAPTISQANQNITYFDGLGRPIQQVAHQQSGTGKDIVTPIEYDLFGRQDKEYLPYVPSTAASLDYKLNALTDVLSYYDATKFDADFSGMTTANINPYSQKEFEASPLNRVMKQAAPGKDWKLGNGHEIRLEYETNTNSDQVRNFGVSFIGGNTEAPRLEDNGIYDSIQLYKTITKDENWVANQSYPKNFTTQEFKDKQGRVILKRTFDDYKWLDTYYVYDDYGNLTYVLPPKVFTYSSITQGYENQDTERSTGISFFTGVNFYNYFYITKSGENLSLSLYVDGVTLGSQLKTGKISDLDFTPDLPDMTLGDIVFTDMWGNSVLAGEASIQNGDLYFFSYGAGLSPDGGDLTAYVTTNLSSFQANYTPPVLDRSTLDDLIYQYRYDGRNRLIEKKIPGKQWEFIVYDKLDRVVATGPSLSPFTSLTGNGWLITKYDVFNRPVLTAWQSASVTSSARATAQTAQNIATTISEAKQDTATDFMVNGVAFRYSNVVSPTTGFHILTVNYYDDYNFPHATFTMPTSVLNQPVYYNNANKPKGLPTGSWIRLLTAHNSYPNERNYVLYDSKARVIKNYTTTFLGGSNSIYTKYDFIGKVLYTENYHKRLSTSSTLKTTDVFSYSDQGRLLTQTQQINTNSPQLIVSNVYDELGQIISKNVGNTIANPLQNIAYSYNIRGWLKGINDLYAIGTDLFAFKINYNDSNNAYYNLYNGNISQTLWQTANIDTSTKSYTFTYDAVNRLTNASDNLNKFNERLSYDRNGNINTLYRTGEIVTGVPSILNPSHFGIMDNLTYTYNAGNQLQIVSDSANDTTGFKDDFGTGTDTSLDYTYDTNGNMITDANKGITNISYNYLNLPMKITFGSTGNIAYIYTATGQKAQKMITNTAPTSVTTTDYMGGYQYLGGELQFFPHAEGYVQNSAGIYSYVFQYKDHLGNVRLSYKDVSTTSIPSLQIVEENNYYPFGLKHNGYNNVSYSSNVALKYKYNGKELQDELGLNMYDYGARNYDPALGRWMNIDPLAEKYVQITPYSYVAGNPLRFVDPNGMEIKAIEGGYNYTEQDAVDVLNLLNASSNNKSTKGSIGIITFGQEKFWGEAMKFAVPEAIMSNVPGSSGRGGIQDFYNSIKEISDQSPNGIGFLAVFSHGDVNSNGYSSAFGEGMIFANSRLNPNADNVYTSDLYNIGVAVDKGYLNFAPYSTVYLGACNASTVYKSANFPNGQSFAMELARATRNSFVYGAANEHMNASNPNNPRNTSFYPERGGTLMINYWPYWSSTGSSIPASSQVIDVVKLAEIYRH